MQVVPGEPGAKVSIFLASVPAKYQNVYDYKYDQELPAEPGRKFQKQKIAYSHENMTHRNISPLHPGFTCMRGSTDCFRNISTWRMRRP